MRILCFWDCPNHTSGLSNMGKYVSDGLKALGHEVVDCNLFDTPKMESLCKNEKWDLSIGIGYWADSQQIEIPKKYGIKTVVYWMSEGKVLFNKEAILKADKLFTISEYSTEIFKRDVPECSPITIYLGTDVDKFTPAEHYKPTKLFSTFGSNETRGVDETIQACQVLSRKGVDYTYVIHNPSIKRSNIERDYTNNIKKICEGMGIKKNILFSDSEFPPQKLPQIYHSMAFYILPARMICGSLPTIEAGACGIPTIAGDWKPLNELVTPDTGVLVKSLGEQEHSRTLYGTNFTERWNFMDPSDCADKIQDLLDDPYKRARLGLRARERVVKDFNAVIQIKKLEQELLKI